MLLFNNPNSDVTSCCILCSRHLKHILTQSLCSKQDDRDRELSPRRDEGRDDDKGYRREFRRDRDYDRRGRGGRGGRGGYRRERSPRRPYNDFEDLKDRTAPVGSRESDRNFSNSVFVGNLGFDVDSQRLRDVFGGVGDVIRADVITQRGRHRGMATVEFATREDADRAIDKLHQTKIGDREIFVRHDNPPPESSRPERSRDRFGDRRDFRDRDSRDRGDFRDRDRRDYGRDRYDDRRDYGRDRERERKPKFAGPHYEVFVGNLPFSVRWQDLKDLFKEAGNVIRADIKMDDYTHRSRGFGMVYFDNQDDVKAAIERFNGYEMEGRAIDVREGKINSDSAAPTHLEREEAPVAANRNSDFTQGVEGDGEPSSIIYVDNLPFATSNQDLIDLFGTIDTVSKAEVKYNEVGRAAGAGVVEYVNEPSAAAAIESLNGYNYGGRDLKVTYAKRP